MSECEWKGCDKPALKPKRFCADHAAPKRYESVHWSRKDIAVLRMGWPNPKVSLQQIKSQLETPRTDGAMKYQAARLKLGKFVTPTAPPKQKPKIEPWPDDMPQFEDHPNAPKRRGGGSAVKRAKSYVVDPGYRPSTVGGGDK